MQLFFAIFFGFCQKSVITACVCFFQMLFPTNTILLFFLFQLLFGVGCCIGGARHTRRGMSFSCFFVSIISVVDGKNKQMVWWCWCKCVCVVVVVCVCVLDRLKNRGDDYMYNHDFIIQTVFLWIKKLHEKEKIIIDIMLGVCVCFFCVCDELPYYVYVFQGYLERQKLMTG